MPRVADVEYIKESKLPPVEVINIVSATLIALNCVEVKGRKGVQFPREYTVTFNRRGTVSHGYQHVPEEGYLYPIGEPIPKNGSLLRIPVAVKKAAEDAFAERNRCSAPSKGSKKL